MLFNTNKMRCQTQLLNCPNTVTANVNAAIQSLYQVFPHQKILTVLLAVLLSGSVTVTGENCQ